MAKKQCIRCDTRINDNRSHMTCSACYMSIYSFMQDFIHWRIIMCSDMGDFNLYRMNKLLDTKGGRNAVFR